MPALLHALFIPFSSLLLLFLLFIPYEAWEVLFIRGDRIEGDADSG